MWNFEQAVVFKAQEGFLEAGLQVLLQTYIHLKTDWILMKYFSGHVERGVYLIGIETTNTESDTKTISFHLKRYAFL